MKGTVLRGNDLGIPYKSASPTEKGATCFPQYQERVPTNQLEMGGISPVKTTLVETVMVQSYSHTPHAADSVTPPERPARTSRTTKFSHVAANQEKHPASTATPKTAHMKKSVQRWQSLHPSPFKGTVPEASSESESESEQLNGPQKPAADLATSIIAVEPAKLPLHQPGPQRGPKQAAIPKDVLTMMALKLGAPKRPPRTATMDSSIATLMSIKDGDQSIEKQFLFQPNPGHRRASSADADAAQCWSRVNDLLFYHDELPIAMAILDILPTLESGSDKKYLNSMIGIFTSNNQIERLIRICANRAVKATKSRKGLLDEKSISKNVLILYCSSYCDEVFTKIMAPTIRGLCGPHRALESSLKGTCDRVLSKVLSTSWPQQVRMVMKAIHTAAAKKCAQSAWQVVTSFFLGDLFGNFIHSLQINRIYEGEAIDTLAARFLRDVAQVFRRLGNSEYLWTERELQHMNDWVEGRVRHVHKFAASMISVTDCLEAPWSIGSLAHGASCDYLMIMQLLTTHREEINRACTNTDVWLQAFISSRVPILWAAFDAHRNRRKSPSASYANARPHSETSSEATAAQLGLALQVPAGMQARGQLWSIVTNATMPKRDENIRMEKMKISVNDVNLSRRALCSVPLLDQFQTLQSLNLSHNRISELTNLPRILRHLDVSHNELRDASPLAALLALETCNLSHNHIVEPLPGLCLMTLVTLNLSHNHIATLKDFGEFPALEDLHLDCNRLVSTDEFKFVSKTFSPKTLSIAGNPVAFDPLYFERIAVLVPSIENIDGRVVRAVRPDLNMTPREDAQGFNSSFKSMNSGLELSPLPNASPEDAVQGPSLWNEQLVENQNSCGESYYSKGSDPSELCFESDDETRVVLSGMKLQELANLSEPDNHPLSVVEATSDTVGAGEISVLGKSDTSMDIDLLLFLQISDGDDQDEQDVGNQLCFQICSATKVLTTRIRINEVKLGGVLLDTVDITILRAEMPNEDSADTILRNLIHQLQDPDSVLLSGTLAHHLIALQPKLVPNEGIIVRRSKMKESPNKFREHTLQMLESHLSAKEARRFRRHAFESWKHLTLDGIIKIDEVREKVINVRCKRNTLQDWLAVHLSNARAKKQALCLVTTHDIRIARRAFFHWRQDTNLYSHSSVEDLDFRLLRNSLTSWQHSYRVGVAVHAVRLHDCARQRSRNLVFYMFGDWKTKSRQIRRASRAGALRCVRQSFCRWAVRSRQSSFYHTIARTIDHRLERLRQKRCWIVLIRHMKDTRDGSEEESVAEQVSLKKCMRAFATLSAFARWHEWQTNGFLWREIDWLSLRLAGGSQTRPAASCCSADSECREGPEEEQTAAAGYGVGPLSAPAPRSPCNTESLTHFSACPSIPVGSDS